MPDEWVDREPTFDSPYYPFRKVVEIGTLAGAEQIPYMITRYLMDLPDGKGYVPQSDNKYPRVRLKKLLYWDTPLPLDSPVPTVEQIKSLQFDPAHPGEPCDPVRGWRIYSQEFTQQAQAVAQSRLHVYLGTAYGPEQRNEYAYKQQVIFKVMCNYAFESNTGMTANSRAYDIVQAVVESVNGVNFTGIGSMRVDSITKIDDERVNMGYKIYSTIYHAGSAPNPYY